MLHLVALSFDHRVGNQVDKVYPPFPDEPYVEDWNQGLPFIGIPDKAHDAYSSAIQFTLPDPHQPCGCVFGLSAYRAIDTTDLNSSQNYLRNQVQKALCVISSIPLYGELEKPLKTALFDHFDSLVDNMEKIFESLKELCLNPTPFSGISYTSLFQSIGPNVLLIIKALFLQKRILFFADNSELVSKMVMAIGSLLPDFLYDSKNDDERFPFTFLDKGSNRFAFAPYVPLQFTETLNNSGSKAALMGTCSELFMVQKIVTYDILVNCRTMPATITGDISDVKIQENEEKFMKNFLNYLKKNWTKDTTSKWIRDQFEIWMNSMITAILRVRHISEIPAFARIYLDWDSSYVFGEKFMKNLILSPDIDAIIKNNNVDRFSPVDENLIKKPKSTLDQFRSLFK
ncbi:hypothetical protein TRFO_28625 [Tritrichomonas foetus]|uniref:UDENN domain-containing protein n=1 Tax=Tritrichomonas foetus TaxID=1144522 RepID=A0A1J4JXT8_9EUKA|nr:hypothetical protein TRFO_28625 [Tritrichomonas foetus]|eukprot:OHT03969.1 hypothetical protein TRFO_28625 [Tritrichomonas foetus]